MIWLIKFMLKQLQLCGICDKYVHSFKVISCTLEWIILKENFRLY